MLTDRVVTMVKRMCEECPKSSIGINLSLDGIGDEHDDIRGVEGNWALSMETWTAVEGIAGDASEPGVDGTYGGQPLQCPSLP
jgi:hypothetical protein